MEGTWHEADPGGALWTCFRYAFRATRNKGFGERAVANQSTEWDRNVLENGNFRGT